MGDYVPIDEFDEDIYSDYRYRHPDAMAERIKELEELITNLMDDIKFCSSESTSAVQGYADRVLQETNEILNKGVIK